MLWPLGYPQSVGGALRIIFKPNATSPLADAHVTEHDRTLFPGQVRAYQFNVVSANQGAQDYNNARVLDFQKVDNYVSNQLSTLETGELSLR